MDRSRTYLKQQAIGSVYDALKNVSVEEGWTYPTQVLLVCEYIESLRVSPPKSRDGWEGYLLSFAEFLETKQESS